MPRINEKCSLTGEASLTQMVMIGLIKPCIILTLGKWLR